jgi:ornithine carbamoyltransferase
MFHFTNLKDISSKDLRKIIIDAKKRKSRRKKLNNLEVDKGNPLKGKLLIQMFEKSSLRTRLSFYLAIKQLGGSTLTLRADELHLSKGGESVEDTAKLDKIFAVSSTLSPPFDKCNSSALSVKVLPPSCLIAK